MSQKTGDGGLTSKRRGQRGISIVELMVALAVIAIALFALISMITHTVAIKEAQKELSIAKQAAATKLEEIKSILYSTIAGTYSAASSTTYNDVDNVTTYSLPNNLFPVKGLNRPVTPDTTFVTSKEGQGKITIDATNAELLDITVEIKWNGIRGESTYTLRSMYSK